MRLRLLRHIPTVAAIAACSVYYFVPAGAGPAVAAGGPADSSAAAGLNTATPIKHMVVIFDENVSFDHYFATYPNAAGFTAAPGTPRVNGLNSTLLHHNPNSAQPQMLARTQALTCDMDHNYTDEQKATDNGLMDKFVEDTEGSAYYKSQYCPKGVVMDYYDGSTVTALWNYAQHYAMNDNSFGTTFGPSTPGAFNLVAGDTAGVLCGPASAVINSAPCTTTPPSTSGATGTDYGDADPYYDDCSKGGTADKSKTIAMTGTNVGDLLNAAGITWGWFQGGFANCTVKHNTPAYDAAAGIDPSTDTNTSSDYNAHHEPFQYFASTANPHHLPPTSVAMIGHTDRANHQYDLTNFWQAADAGNLPAVSYLKAPSYQDGHAGYSDPLDEQVFLTSTINHLESLPSWSSTAVVIEYDDSDGWYDHVMGPIVNHSSTTLDANCGSSTDTQPGRCGYGPRLPFLVVSPYARTNYVSSNLTDQSSSLRFIEDNWLSGKRTHSDSADNWAGSIDDMFNWNGAQPGDNHRLILDTSTGQVQKSTGGPAVTITFSSKGAGQGYVNFGTSCNGLVNQALSDAGTGTTSHSVVITGNDLAGTVGNLGLTPGQTYFYETVTSTPGGQQIDNNGGACYTFTVPTA